MMTKVFAIIIKSRSVSIVAATYENQRYSSQNLIPNIKVTSDDWLNINCTPPQKISKAVHASNICMLDFLNNVLAFVSPIIIPMIARESRENTKGRVRLLDIHFLNAPSKMVISNIARNILQIELECVFFLGLILK